MKFKFEFIFLIFCFSILFLITCKTLPKPKTDISKPIDLKSNVQDQILPHHKIEKINLKHHHKNHNIILNHYDSANLVYNDILDTLIEVLKGGKETFELNDSNIVEKWQGTVNFNLRKPNYVIIHHTAQNSYLETLKTFTLKRTGVSAHYVISKDGTIYHMLNDFLRAWHAGSGKWGSLSDINSASIGIELDNDGYSPFDSLQINSLIKLLGYLKNKYRIPTTNFIGHLDIASTRKNDPNIFFPWEYLAKNGFGVWANPDSTLTIEPNFNVNTALRLIGYDVQDSLAALVSFKRHFRGDTSRVITDDDKRVLKVLSKYN